MKEKGYDDLERLKGIVEELEGIVEDFDAYLLNEIFELREKMKMCEKRIRVLALLRVRLKERLLIYQNG